jgi:VanZ family protein
MESDFSDRSFISRWGPALGLMGAIFVFSSLPAAAIPSWEGDLELIVKKGGHMVGYGLLAIAFHRGIGGPSPRGWILAWTFTILYGVSDELHQGFVPGRMSSMLDVGIDGLGGLVGLTIWFYFRNIHAR